MKENIQPLITIGISNGQIKFEHDRHLSEFITFHRESGVKDLLFILCRIAGLVEKEWEQEIKSKKILPCPICNSKTVVLRNDHPDPLIKSPLWGVFCSNKNCYLNKGIGYFFQYRDEAIDDWNTTIRATCPKYSE